jgi:hypothetical protein
MTAVFALGPASIAARMPAPPAPTINASKRRVGSFIEAA